MTAIQQTINYDAERDRNFPREIMARPGGEKLYGCIQCGTCSATCPVSIYMDHTPRQLMALTRAGFKQDVLVGLEFQAAIESDSAPVHELVLELLRAGIEIHCLRDLTRGGLASALNEIAEAASVRIAVEETAIPVQEAVHAACEILGLDP